MFRLAAETEFLFRPIPKPKPKGVSQFRPNRISAKLAEIRPKAETESVSVVHYLGNLKLINFQNMDFDAG